MIQRLRCTLLFFGLAAIAQAAEAPKDEQLRSARQVRDIFEAKCLDCHGPELPRPKGKFGYVLDLKRVAKNPDFVVRGDPEKSELFVMVRDNEMPGEDASVPPLTPEEVEIVRRWIEIGAPGELPGTADAEQPPPAPAQKLKRPLWKQALHWIGQFHPLATHFPIALLFVAVFAEGLAWWTGRESWMMTIRFLVIIGALGAVPAAALGWANAHFQSYTGDLAPVLSWHRWLGTTSAVWGLVCAWLSVASECREGSRERQQFRGALLIGAVLIGATGFLGSALIYGLNHYAWE